MLIIERFHPLSGRRPAHVDPRAGRSPRPKLPKLKPDPHMVEWGYEMHDQRVRPWCRVRIRT